MEKGEIWKAVGIGLALVAAVAYVFMKMREQTDPAPSETGYYTGPMRAKGGNTWGTEDGKEVPPPGGQTAEQSIPRSPNPDEL